MFRLPIVRAFFRASPQSATATSLLHSTRIPSHIPRSTPLIRHLSSRTRGTSSTAFLPSRLLSRQSQSRHFSESARSRAKYNRFEEPQFPRLQDGEHLQFWLVLIAVGGSFYVYNLETVELTGRTRFNCVSDDLEKQMGDHEYHAIMNTAEGLILPPWHHISQEVTRVFERLIAHTPVQDTKWEVHVINDMSEQNAFVLPNGKVFVYTGILPVCGNADGLAAVLGHEIAHVLAHHQAERMSHSIPSVILTYGLVYLLGSLGHFASQMLNWTVNLPNTRVQEAEADNIGLMLMAKACYNPRAVVDFWNHMHKSERVRVPEFMSTHPSHFNRMQSMSERLYKAESLYENSGCHMVRGYIPKFTDAIDHYAGPQERAPPIRGHHPRGGHHGRGHHIQIQPDDSSDGEYFF
ncbi:metalloendopeptidase [Aspergillus tubingensis]|uniref:Peptidase n=3 Tax=Aspergillus subgen. Circumdati TaxID=2720871 RepID=A0A117DXN5_ASPNG|nr:peptidase [Aspergillus tubingensis]GAQ38240.1 peptidase [Aspergillus niger]GFN13353.1 peptidase [Aspergillus tubingensis]GLA77823.1 metalloendopeptidase [Aspergillus tubingensis]GLA93006.1 metalloendopeptidase [Aspergillus tubingensis]